MILFNIMAFAQTIFDVARANGVPVVLANLIVAQARHETADFTSNVFKSCNNAFGYKYAGQPLPVRPCVNSPEGNSYASYPDLADSVRELVAWIKRRQEENKFPANLSEITTAEKYAQLLKDAGFYGDPVTVYTSGLKKFAVNYGPAIGFGTLAIIGFAIFLYSRHKQGR